MSRFLRVRCECGNEQTVFGNATTKVYCSSCGAQLTEPTGSRAKVIHGKVIKVL